MKNPLHNAIEKAIQNNRTEKLRQEDAQNQRIERLRQLEQTEKPSGLHLPHPIQNQKRKKETTRLRQEIQKYEQKKKNQKASKRALIGLGAVLLICICIAIFASLGERDAVLSSDQQQAVDSPVERLAGQSTIYDAESSSITEHIKGLDPPESTELPAAYTEQNSAVVVPTAAFESESKATTDELPEVSPETISNHEAANGPSRSSEGASSGSSSQTQTKTDASAYAFVGSNESNKYHYPSCRFAKKIKAENLIGWDTIAEAEAAGYEPCGVCHPH
jgi:hypothetical protein